MEKPAGLRKILSANKTTYPGDVLKAQTYSVIEYLNNKGNIDEKPEIILEPKERPDDKTLAIRRKVLDVLLERQTYVAECLKKVEKDSDLGFYQMYGEMLDVTVKHLTAIMASETEFLANAEIEDPEEGEVDPGSQKKQKGTRARTQTLKRKHRMLLSETNKSLSHTLLKRNKLLKRVALAGSGAGKKDTDRAGPSFRRALVGADCARTEQTDLQLAKNTSAIEALSSTMTDMFGQLKSMQETSAKQTDLVVSMANIIKDHPALHADNTGYWYGYGDDDYEPEAEKTGQGRTPSISSSDLPNLGLAKPVFPKYTTNSDIDTFFASAERYFRLCGTDPALYVDYTLLAMPQYSMWWQQHVLAHPADALSWDTFKLTIRQFLTTDDPSTSAMGKLLRLKQHDMSAADYSARFMQLVRDANCQPTDTWLTIHYLQNMSDTSLIRAASSNNGQKWNSITDLVQHVNTITALRPAFLNKNKYVPNRSSSRAADAYKGNGRGGYNNGGRGGYNNGGRYEHDTRHNEGGRGDRGRGRGRGGWNPDGGRGHYNKPQGEYRREQPKLNYARSNSPRRHSSPARNRSRSPARKGDGFAKLENSLQAMLHHIQQK